jgi:hypothetical protein
MGRWPGPQEPAHYRLRVDGHLDGHWAAWFAGLTLTPEDDGTTSLSGQVCDQAQLHGLLAKVRDLGVTLICVQAVRPTGEDRRAPAEGYRQGLPPPRPGA